jgi:bilin biosynthesis protein
MRAALADVVAVLAVAAAALVATIIAMRAALIHRAQRDARLRPPAEQALAEFLSGITSSIPEPSGKHERAVLLDVALEAVGDLRGSERASLAELLERLGFAADAIAGLAARRPVTRRRAAETLTMIATPTAVPALTASLRDRDPIVRTSCARTLVETGGKDVIPAVVATAERDMRAAPGAASAVLLAVATHWPEQLAPLLRPEAPTEVRSVVLTIAGELRLAQHAPLLRECLGENDEVAANAARGLGRIGDFESAADLRDLAGDQGRSPRARAAAVTALGWIGGPSAVAALERQLTGGDWLVLAAATEALARLGGPGEAVLTAAAASARPDVSALAEAALQP